MLVQLWPNGTSLSWPMNLPQAVKFLQHDLSFSSTTVEDMGYLADCVVHALKQNGVSPSKQLNRCNKFVKINGITYYCKMYVVLNVADDTPVLGRIDNIYIQDMICHFPTSSQEYATLRLKHILVVTAFSQLIMSFPVQLMIC